MCLACQQPLVDPHFVSPCSCNCCGACFKKNWLEQPGVVQGDNSAAAAAPGPPAERRCPICAAPATSVCPNKQLRDQLQRERSVMRTLVCSVAGHDNAVVVGFCSCASPAVPVCALCLRVGHGPCQGKVPVVTIDNFRKDAVATLATAKARADELEAKASTYLSRIDAANDAAKKHSRDIKDRLQHCIASLEKYADDATLAVQHQQAELKVTEEMVRQGLFANLQRRRADAAMLLRPDAPLDSVVCESPQAAAQLEELIANDFYTTLLESKLPYERSGIGGKLPRAAAHDDGVVGAQDVVTLPPHVERALETLDGFFAGSNKSKDHRHGTSATSDSIRASMMDVSRGHAQGILAAVDADMARERAAIIARERPTTGTRGAAKKEALVAPAVPAVATASTKKGKPITAPDAAKSVVDSLPPQPVAVSATLVAASAAASPPAAAAAVRASGTLRLRRNGVKSGSAIAVEEGVVLVRLIVPSPAQLAEAKLAPDMLPFVITEKPWCTAESLPQRTQVTIRAPIPERLCMGVVAGLPRSRLPSRSGESFLKCTSFYGFSSAPRCGFALGQLFTEARNPGLATGSVVTLTMSESTREENRGIMLLHVQVVASTGAKSKWTVELAPKQAPPTGAPSDAKAGADLTHSDASCKEWFLVVAPYLSDDSQGRGVGAAEAVVAIQSGW